MRLKSIGLLLVGFVVVISILILWPIPYFIGVYIFAAIITGLEAIVLATKKDYSLAVGTSVGLFALIVVVYLSFLVSLALSGGQ
jgi:hypothetical protein